MVMKHNPAQFKADAVALYRSRPGATIAQIADDLGINRETLRSWIRIDDEHRGGTTRPGRPAEPAVAGFGRGGERRVAASGPELEEERDILRKAARYFAGETRW
jgi:transposase